MFDIQEELKKLPKSPGVYIMHDKKDEILYVGKAVNLYNRVHQYFQSSRGKTATLSTSSRTRNWKRWCWRTT